MKKILKEYEDWRKKRYTNSEKLVLDTIKGRAIIKISAAAFYAGWKACKMNSVKEYEEIDKQKICGDNAYYKRESTHEEIMTKWWKMPDGEQWWRVESYRPDRGYWLTTKWRNKSWFVGKESAEVPHRH